MTRAHGSGPTTGFSDGTSGEEWHVVKGEGAYEGLTAVYRWDSDGISFEGVILPGELPPLPDPVALPAE